MKRLALRCEKIYTAIDEKFIDGYVILEGKYILFSGTTEEAQKFINEDTEIINVEDKFMMPGFHDFHIHLLMGAMAEFGGILRYSLSEEDAVKTLYEKNKDRLDQEWIFGGAWDHYRWPTAELPTKHSLDKAFPDTKVFLLNKECHGAWANSKALEYFNITKDTKDPNDGWYSRDEEGNPEGYLHETALLSILPNIIDNMSDEDIASYTKAYAETANKFGITSVSDVALKNSIRESAYKLLDDRGDLNMRVTFAKPMMDDLNDLLEVKSKYENGDMVRFIGVKDFVDGTPMGHSGFMLKGYADRQDFLSNSLIEEKTLEERVSLLADNGIKVRLHACGDAAVRLCLDVFEKANLKNADKDLRHCVEHFEVVDPEDMERVGKLGVVASIQPEHLPKYGFYSHPFQTRLDEERMKNTWPFESMRKGGAVLACGTDYPVADMSPFRTVYRAVTRLTNEYEPKGGFNPEERLSVHEVLKAYTVGAAYGANRDHELGTIEAGKLADIAVLDDDIFEIATDMDKMFSLNVVMTIMNGRIVYKRG